MSRLSQDREEREAQLREYEHDLGSRSSRRSSTTTTTTPTVETKSSGGITVGQVVLGVGALALAWLVGRPLLFWAIGAVLHVLQIAVGVAIVAGIGWLVYKWYTGKRRRI